MDDLDRRVARFRTYLPELPPERAHAIAGAVTRSRRGVRALAWLPAAGLGVLAILMVVLLVDRSDRREPAGPTTPTVVGPPLIGKTAFCGEIVVTDSAGGAGIIYAIRDVVGIGCDDAERLAELAALGQQLPAGWSCTPRTCWNGRDVTTARARFDYINGGDAG